MAKSMGRKKVSMAGLPPAAPKDASNTLKIRQAVARADRLLFNEEKAIKGSALMRLEPIVAARKELAQVWEPLSGLETRNNDSRGLLDLDPARITDHRLTDYQVGQNVRRAAKILSAAIDAAKQRRMGVELTAVARQLETDDDDL